MRFLGVMSSQIADLIAQLDISIPALAQVYADLGDPSDAATIQRRIRRRLRPDAEQSGEAVAFLNLLILTRRAQEALDTIQRQDARDGRRRSRPAK